MDREKFGSPANPHAGRFLPTPWKRSRYSGVVDDRGPRIRPPFRIVGIPGLLPTALPSPPHGRLAKFLSDRHPPCFHGVEESGFAWAKAFKKVPLLRVAFAPWELLLTVILESGPLSGLSESRVFSPPPCHSLPHEGKAKFMSPVARYVREAGEIGTPCSGPGTGPAAKKVPPAACRRVRLAGKIDDRHPRIRPPFRIVGIPSLLPTALPFPTPRRKGKVLTPGGVIPPRCEGNRSRGGYVAPIQSDQLVFHSPWMLQYSLTVMEPSGTQKVASGSWPALRNSR